jgi:hypothetical protein
MAYRDLRSNMDAVHTLAPAARAATANGVSVDLRGFEGAMAVVHFGTWTDGTHTPSLEESNDGTTFTAVAAADLIGSFSAVTSAAGNNTVQRVGYSGSRRFIRVTMTVATATTGATSSAAIVRGNPATIQPVP